MKFMLLNQNGKKMQIPGAYLEKSGLSEYPKLDVHAMDQALVLLPRQMTALEMIHAMGSLMNLSFEMFSRLVDECGPCEECCGEGQCPYEDMEINPVLDLPPEIREKMGIAEDVKLCFEVDEENNSIKIYAAEKDSEPELADVPVWLLNVFNAVGLCLGELDELIQSEDIVYGD